MKRKISKKGILVGIIALILGVLLVRQFVVISKSQSLTAEESLANLAYSIVDDANSIFDLQNKYNSLKSKNDSFSFDIKDKTKVKDDVINKIKSYGDINGLNPVSGRGIEIKVTGTMVTEEMVDLINGIRNTRPEAIAINGKRLVYRSYFIVNNDGKLEFDDNTANFPIYVQALGDPEALSQALARSGGILDVLKKNSFDKISFSVEKKDNLSLPAYNGKIDFRFAKTVNY